MIRNPLIPARDQQLRDQLEGLKLTDLVPDDFMNTANPDFDMREIVPSWQQTEDAPALHGRNTKLPAFLSLQHGEIAVSREERARYIHVEELGVWVPDRHWIVVQGVRDELETVSDLTTVGMRHGTNELYRAGCTGPLCRRAKRVNNEQYRYRRPSVHRRAPRNTLVQNREALLQKMNEQREARQRSQYEAVDELLALYTQFAAERPVTVADEVFTDPTSKREEDGPGTRKSDSGKVKGSTA